MGRVFGYVRVSTDEQDNSVKNQQDKITEYARKEALDLTHIFVDEDVTAAIPLRNRPAGRVLWDSLDPGDTVVFNRVDRVFRSVCDAADTAKTWQDRGVRCVILDLGIDLATPAGRLFFHQLASFAEFERALIGQRTKETAAYLKKVGRPYGSARPFGWKRVGTGPQSRYEPVPQERELAQRVLTMHLSGQSYREIAWTLMRERVTKPGHSATEQRKKGTWYSVSDVHGLAQAARLGFPIVPRSALLAAAKQAMQTVCSD